jgi:hypothetical protein
VRPRVCQAHRADWSEAPGCCMLRAHLPIPEGSGFFSPEPSRPRDGSFPGVVPMTTARSASAHPLHQADARFTRMHARIIAHGEIVFRHVKCPSQKDDFIAELVALCWRWHLRLAERGIDSSQFITAMATFAARRVRSGGRLVGMEKSRDAMSPLAQRVHGFAVERIPDHTFPGTSLFAEALEGNTRTSIPAQVCYRLDFAAWRATRTARDRRIVDRLMLGDRTTEVSRKFGLSPGRISQLRREFHADWCKFCEELPPQV